MIKDYGGNRVQLNLKSWVQDAIIFINRIPQSFYRNSTVKSLSFFALDMIKQ